MTHGDFKKQVIDDINENILKDYDITLDSFEIAEKEAEKETILAFFSPMSNTISVNVLNKQIFNDYVQFIERMIHEHVHKVNHAKGLVDVVFEGERGERQIHNENFRNAMRDLYGIYCENESYTGGADMSETRNEEALNMIISRRIKHKKAWARVQENYLKEIYIEVTDRSNPYVDNGKGYKIEEEEGEEI